MFHLPYTIIDPFLINGAARDDGSIDTGFINGGGYNFGTNDGGGWGDGSRCGDGKGGTSTIAWKAYPHALIQYW